MVLLDWTLPGMSGKEVIAELPEVQPDCRVILASAYSEEVVANQLGREHDWAFIRKPYRITDLTNLLQDVLGPAAVAPRSPVQSRAHGGRGVLTRPT